MGNFRRARRIQPSGNFAMSRSQVQLDVELIGLPATDEIDYQTLLRVGEQRFIVTAFKILIESSRGVKIGSATPGHPHNKQMLTIRYSTLLVVDDLAVAIKRQPILYVAADSEDRDGFVARSDASQTVGQGAS